MTSGVQGDDPVVENVHQGAQPTLVRRSSVGQRRGAGGVSLPAPALASHRGSEIRSGLDAGPKRPLAICVRSATATRELEMNAMPAYVTMTTLGACEAGAQYDYAVCEASGQVPRLRSARRLWLTTS